MELKAFDYDLPEGLIAQRPLERRDSSRLMVVDRRAGGVSHGSFADLPSYLGAGDVLVLNDTRVVPARLRGKKGTGGAAEVLVVETGPAPGRARCMITPSRRLRQGAELFFEGGWKARVRGRDAGGFFVCDFTGPEGGGVGDLLKETGEVPLPPYIRRGPGGPTAEDGSRYQTVFAAADGAVAAPTAGLHFTDRLLGEIEGLGVEVLYVTLHTGPGTFLPIRAGRIEDHRMTSERYSIDPGVFESVRRAKEEKRRVVAVGSTSTRALEASVAGGFDRPVLCGATDLFIRPGFRFRVVDALVTNFHLPRSTLVMLAAAFAGRGLLMRAYREAVAEGYRFYSYGDAMLIL